MNIYSVFVVSLTIAWTSALELAGQGLAESAQVWQPYRRVAPTAAPNASPAQYLFEAPYVATPPQMSSQAEGNRPGEACCTDPFSVSGNPLPMVFDSRFVDPALVPVSGPEQWDWHVLPGDVIWHSYWAGAKEPRISGVTFNEANGNVSLLDVTLGGRTSLFRYGTVNQGRPEGWELQLEGASLLRLNLDSNWDLEAVDFRFGLPIIYGRGKSQWKFSYYHLSSHLGDERIIRTMSTASRINFSRDTFVLGYSYFPRPAWRWYAEAGWAFHADEGTDPWEFQFGLDYAQPGPTGSRGTPFVAINAHLRQEVNFGGNLVTQAGWLWRGQSGHVMRTGLHYFNGKSNQFEFVNQFEQQIGVGLWYDY